MITPEYKAAIKRARNKLKRATKQDWSKIHDITKCRTDYHIVFGICPNCHELPSRSKWSLG